MMAPRRRIGSSNLFLVFTLLINLANFFWLSKGINQFLSSLVAFFTNVLCLIVATFNIIHAFVHNIYKTLSMYMPKSLV